MCCISNVFSWSLSDIISRYVRLWDKCMMNRSATMSTERFILGLYVCAFLLCRLVVSASVHCSIGWFVNVGCSSSSIGRFGQNSIKAPSQPSVEMSHCVIKNHFWLLTKHFTMFMPCYSTFVSDSRKLLCLKVLLKKTFEHCLNTSLKFLITLKCYFNSLFRLFWSKTDSISLNILYMWQ